MDEGGFAISTSNRWLALVQKALNAWSRVCDVNSMMGEVGFPFEKEPLNPPTHADGSGDGAAGSFGGWPEGRLGRLNLRRLRGSMVVGNHDRI